MRNWLLWVTAAAAVAGPVHATDHLTFAPAPAWVRPVTLAAGPAPEAAFGPYAVLNRSVQVKFGDDVDTTYSELAIKIQSPLGLGMGEPVFTWNPDSETPVIHKAHIIRDGKVIDVLARGQAFVVMRREDNLDSSMLDGRLTATLQTEGLQVGDIFDFAMSNVRKTGIRQGRSIALWTISTNEVAKVEYRAVWPNSKPIRWRLSDDMAAPNISKTADTTEFTVNLVNYKKPETPDGAPDRFSHFGTVQFSQFASWRKVSAIMAPYYARNSVVRDTSPLKAEVAKIKARGGTAKDQAEAALHLVEDQVRYAYRAADDNGHIPADADLTWLRRFGDCKGKTALLLALLKALDIEAVPAVVDTEDGDGMNERLPMVGLFDHVIVRATIGGKVYWLDGTRLGDVGLDTLSPPAYKWALPLRVEGADLEAIVVPPLDEPAAEINLFLDATAGIDGPVPAHAEVIQRGRAAIHQRLTWGSLSPAEVDARLRTYWRTTYPGIKITTITQGFDVATGEMHFAMEGMAKMVWFKPKNSQSLILYVKDTDIDNIEEIDREPGLHADAPVTVEFPVFDRLTAKILLPDGGKGFEVVGAPVDVTLGGVQYKRLLKLEGNVFTVERSQRSLVPEIPLADARAAYTALEVLSEQDAYLETTATEAEVAMRRADSSTADGTPASAIAGTTAAVSQDKPLRSVPPRMRKTTPMTPPPGDAEPPRPPASEVARVYATGEVP